MSFGGLATCSYVAFKPEMGQAVRTSLGYPQFWRGPRLAYARLAAPKGAFDNPKVRHDQEAFRAVYLAHLDAHAGELAAELASIARVNGGKRLVLLCFESLDRQPWCHRMMLASWLEEHTGLDVPELGPVASIPAHAPLREDHPRLPL